jgi:hypothetical protein
MQIIVLGEVIENKDITEIYDVERDKKAFFNRDAGFIIRFMDGSSKTFSERIPYESYPSEIREIKDKWSKLMDKVIKQWEEDKHKLKEFTF